MGPGLICAVVPCMPAFEWGGVHLPWLIMRCLAGHAALGWGRRVVLVRCTGGRASVASCGCALVRSRPRRGPLSCGSLAFFWTLPSAATIFPRRRPLHLNTHPHLLPLPLAVAFLRLCPKLGLSSACMRRPVGRPRGGVRALAACTSTCACGGRCGSCRSRHMSAFVVAGLLVCFCAGLHVCALPWCGG